MFNESRIDIYDYLYSLVYGVVTNNVYRMGEPVDTTKSDVNDGFVVINVGVLNDNSEFDCDAYGWARCTITAYIPKKSRGRLNGALYRTFERSINRVVDSAMYSDENTVYYINDESILSYDQDEITLKGNQYHVYVKSFTVMIDNQNRGSNLFIGYGGKDLNNEEDIRTLGNLQEYTKDNAFGEYAISIPNFNYLWICFDKPLKSITTKSFSIPTDSPIRVGTFFCYRTANAIGDDNMEFSIK